MNVTVLLLIPQVALDWVLSFSRMVSVNTSSTLFFNHVMVGRGSPVNEQVMLMVPPRKCSTIGTGSSRPTTGTAKENSVMTYSSVLVCGTLYIKLCSSILRCCQ